MIQTDWTGQVARHLSQLDNGTPTVKLTKLTKKPKKERKADVPDKVFNYALAVRYVRKVFYAYGIKETGRAQWQARERGESTTYHVVAKRKDKLYRKGTDKLPNYAKATDMGIEHDVVQDAYLTWHMGNVGHKGKTPKPMSTRKAVRYAIKTYLRSQRLYSWYIEHNGKLYGNDKGNGYTRKTDAKREAEHNGLKDYAIIPFVGKLRATESNTVHTGNDQHITYTRNKGYASKQVHDIDTLADTRDTGIDLIDLLPSSPSAKQVVEMLAMGISTTDIADVLGVHKGTMSRRIQAIREALPLYYGEPLRNVGEPIPTIPHACPVRRGNGEPAKVYHSLDNGARLDSDDTLWVGNIPAMTNGKHAIPTYRNGSQHEELCGYTQPTTPITYPTLPYPCDMNGMTYAGLWYMGMITQADHTFEEGSGI